MKRPSVNLRDPKIRKAALIVLVGIAGWFGWLQYVYQSRQAECSQLEQTLKERARKLTEIKNMKPLRNRLTQELAVKSAALDSLKAIFPDQKEVPRLIFEINRLCQASGVQTVRFDPLKDEEREYYVENNYSISLQGAYHDFAAFLARLANLKLIVNLSDMGMVATRRLGSGASPDAAAQTPAVAVPDEEYRVSATFKMTTFSSRK